MKIRSVAVLGAGAVGAYILYGLSQTKDVEFCVVADGARKERLERDGILIDDKKAVKIFRPAVRTPQEARGADLLLVAVKYTALWRISAPSRLPVRSFSLCSTASTQRRRSEQLLILRRSFTLLCG